MTDKKNDTIYELAIEGNSILDVAQAISEIFGYSIDSALKELTDKGSSAAVSYHIGMLDYHEAAEGALFRATESGDVDAIELLLKLREEMRIDRIRKELF